MNVRSNSAEELCNRVLTQPPLSARAAAEAALAAQDPKVDTSQVVDAYVATMRQSATEDSSLAVNMLRYHLTPYAYKHGGDFETVVFWPEDFVSFFSDLAREAGIDLHTFGAKLDPESERPEFIVGIAFMVLSEIAGHYVEVPGALTEFRVPRTFLVTMAAAMIGIATGKAATLDPAIAGAVGSVGSLLLTILAERLASSEEPKTNWKEELVLRTLEKHGRMSADQLHKTTNINRPLLQRTIRSLRRKHLVRPYRRWEGGRQIFYELAQ